MAVYDVDGLTINSIYDADNSAVSSAYDVNGDAIYSASSVDYTDYSYTQKWTSKGIGSTQGFDIYNGLVFWVAKSGDSTVPSNCYVWNLSDGTQALNDPYITVYSGHGNNLSFDFPTLYATPAYPSSKAYVNTFDNNYVATLVKTLTFNDGSTDCDACIDEYNKNILWTLGHTDNHTNPDAPFLISKWDLTELTQNYDGTYTPRLINTVQTEQPLSYYFQGCQMHDDLLWYASGSGDTRSYVYAINPRTGEKVYTIDLETNTEPECAKFYPDSQAVGGYALYVGFQGMSMRKYTFAALS